MENGVRVLELRQLRTSDFKLQPIYKPEESHTII
jgi:hypothetical protein